MTRTVIYARFSSDMQRDASIDDQVRVCRVRAEREGWTVGEVYADHALSGAIVQRPAYQALLAALGRGEIDLILAESLDRLSRDPEHIAAFHKQARFAGARIVTLTEGEIGDLQIAFSGTMGALYLQDLATRTRRGLEGRIRQGRGVGTVPYGYQPIHRLGPDGEPERGLRAIEPTEAAIVRRIFAEFLAGHSPRHIGQRLNTEGVSSPSGKIWYDSTIRGRPAGRTACCATSSMPAPWSGAATATPSTRSMAAGSAAPTRSRSWSSSRSTTWQSSTRRPGMSPRRACKPKPAAGVRATAPNRAALASGIVVAHVTC